MEIHLIRHTAPQIAKGICYGQSDIELADTFEEEVHLIKKKLPRLNPDFAVFSSPLKRCKKLAITLFHSLITLDGRLMELNFGEWELKAWNNIPKEEINPWMKDFVNTPCPNGEAYQELYQRCIDFLTELKSSDVQQAVIITHAGPIRAINAYLNNIDLKDSFDLKVNYGSIIQFNY
ncbi:alpha-ribazole phosphatase [Echinicola sp. CAU 1574]|uniref:Alpha-ribazole phosphatase n=1 Tax=Echinicola arenosa TaxID=2774144 RepID=A0ABR9APX7_9BACT|nr:alpha-ribazole phosphatase [Echinicola arenosa]MBD8490845.1 alpha-ribazole phosphatase [Echinicola arenosa]